MKIYYIFKKNLKIVSRNFSYLLVLFIFPVILILVSSIVLNSINYNNVKVGIVNNNQQSNLNLDAIRNLNYYDSVDDCLYDLKHKGVTICIEVQEDNESYKTIIYVDNTLRVVEYYSKQFILETILKEKDTLFDKTTENINAKTEVYSVAIANATIELTSARNDLSLQEETLKQYKNNISRLKSDFNVFYIPLKENEQNYRNLKSIVNQSNNDLNTNLALFRSQKQQLIGNITALQLFLKYKLNSSDYNYANNQLISITTSLKDIEIILNNLEDPQESMNQISQIFNDIDALYRSLDSINTNLNNFEVQIDQSIIKTQESKRKLDYFLSRLNQAQGEIYEMSSQLNSKKSIVNFRTAFDLPSTINNVFLIFPMLISIIISFTSLVLSNMFVLKQISNKSYLRELITPTRDMTFLFSDYLVNLFFVAIQGFVLFLIGFYWFGVTIDKLGFFIVAIFLASSIFIFIGMSIAYLIRNQSLSMLISIFLLILLLILSDLLAPSALANPLIRLFIEINPLIILERILTDVLILNQGINDFSNFIIELILFLFITMTISFISKKICRSKITA